jgi:DNA helicase-2/ATP-dependent DNA helicase PcrA
MPDGLYTPRDDLLEGLNPAQREAVTYDGGHLLVVAGAGTGKTRVLTRRIAWRIARGAPPESILAITFTNKAAEVLVDRLAALPGGSRTWAGTFHAFGAWCLRRHADRIGLDRSFTVLDSEDQSRLLRDLLQDLGRSRQYSPEEMAQAISFRKCGGSGHVPLVLEEAEGADVADEVAALYAKRLRAASLFDFDDLLVEPLRLLSESPEAAAAIGDRFREVLVDEFQDTNAAQMALVLALAARGAEVCAVGDPDQSIYRWRGATVRNILRLPDVLPGTRVVTLEENYRSTKRILAVAEGVIERNLERHEKRLRTSNPSGEKVLSVRCLRSYDEANEVVSLLSRWMQEGLPASDLAVFFRVNHVSRGIETALRDAGIPYEMVSGVEFWQRREVKDVLAYARLVENPRDDAAFARVVNVPRRGVGDASLARLRAFATAQGASLAEAAALSASRVSGAARKGLDAFLSVLARLRSLPRAPVASLLEAIVVQTGYRDDLARRDDPLEASRVENVDELLLAARRADEGRPEEDLRAFLERATLVSEQDGYDPAAPRVRLMTVHAAKGLEFRGVVVVGVEDGWFPHARSTGRDEVEEERRLFYVALTRARERLALTHASMRESFGGGLQVRQASPFLADAPPEDLVFLDRTGVYFPPPASRRPWPGAGRPASWTTDAHGRLDEDPDDDVVSEGAPDADDVFARGAPDVPAPGERVRHPHFGAGRMVGSSGEGERLRVVVDFDEHGTKTILWSYAPLVRLTDEAQGGTT